MSNKYLVFGVLDAQTKVAEIEAESPEEASEKFWDTDEASPSVCNYCSKELEIADCMGSIVLDAESSDVLLNTTSFHERNVALQSELDAKDELLSLLFDIADKMYEALPCDAKYSSDCTPCGYSDFINHNSELYDKLKALRGKE